MPQLGKPYYAVILQMITVKTGTKQFNKVTHIKKTFWDKLLRRTPDPIITVGSESIYENQISSVSVEERIGIERIVKLDGEHVKAYRIGSWDYLLIPINRIFDTHEEAIEKAKSIMQMCEYEGLRINR